MTSKFLADSSSQWWRPVEPSIVESSTSTTIEVTSPLTSAGHVLIGIALAMNTYFGLMPWMVLHVIAVESDNLWLELPGAALGIALAWALVRQIWPPFARTVLRLDDEGWQVESRLGPLRRRVFFRRGALRGVAFESQPTGLRRVDRLIASVVPSAFAPPIVIRHRDFDWPLTLYASPSGGARVLEVLRRNLEP